MSIVFCCARIVFKIRPPSERRSLLMVFHSAWSTKHIQVCHPYICSICLMFTSLHEHPVSIGRLVFYRQHMDPFASRCIDRYEDRAGDRISEIAGAANKMSGHVGSARRCVVILRHLQYMLTSLHGSFLCFRPTRSLGVLLMSRARHPLKSRVGASTERESLDNAMSQRD